MIKINFGSSYFLECLSSSLMKSLNIIMSVDLWNI
jgi:hypothetical protein